MKIENEDQQKWTEMEDEPSNDFTEPMIFNEPKNLKKNAIAT